MYKPIRIVKDIQVNVPDKRTAERLYPHGELKSIGPGSYQIIYRFPQRIDAPTPAELNALLSSGHAFEIPQADSKVLHAADDPLSPLAGSRKYSLQRRRKAVKEEIEREEGDEPEKDEEKPQKTRKKSHKENEIAEEQSNE